MQLKDDDYAMLGATTFRSSSLTWLTQDDDVVDEFAGEFEEFATTRSCSICPFWLAEFVKIRIRFFAANLDGLPGNFERPIAQMSSLYTSKHKFHAFHDNLVEKFNFFFIPCLALWHIHFLAFFTGFSCISGLIFACIPCSGGFYASRTPF